MKITLMRPFRIFGTDINPEGIEIPTDSIVQTIDSKTTQFEIDFKERSISFSFSDSSEKKLVFEDLNIFYENLFLLDEEWDLFFDKRSFDYLSYLLFYINKTNHAFSFDSSKSCFKGYKKENIDGTESLTLIYEADNKEFVDLVLDFIRLIDRRP